MTQNEMRERFQAWQDERTAFTFGDWLTLSIPERDAREAEINARHHYRHGWIIVNGHSFDMEMAFPEQQFLNVWD